MGYYEDNPYIEKGSNYLKYIGNQLTTGDDLYLVANRIDSGAYILLEGNGYIRLSHVAGWATRIYDGSTALFLFNKSGATEASINTSITNCDLFLAPNGSGVVKFGTYTAGAATDSTGYITIKDAAGTTRKLMVQA